MPVRQSPSKKKATNEDIFRISKLYTAAKSDVGVDKPSDSKRDVTTIAKSNDDARQKNHHDVKNEHIPSYDLPNSDDSSIFSSLTKKRDMILDQAVDLCHKFDITASTENQYRFSDEVQNAAS